MEPNVCANSLPYNSANILLQEADVHNILSKYGVVERIHDINIYRKAFVHRSYCTRKNENFINGNVQCPQECIPLQEESNERLEFLGDSVLSVITANYLYQRYSIENEGFLTRMRTKLVNGNTLAWFAKELELYTFVLLSKQIEENEGRMNKKILEDCFESFLGAMFTDFQEAGKNSLELCSTWLINFIEETIDFSSLVSSKQNYKDIFLKFYQQKCNEIPRFFEVNTECVSNGKIFTVCLKNKKNIVISTGTGSSKKEAENNAAKNALEYFGQ